jgi:hypothetical protein
MENGSRKIGLRMALGILAAITIIGAVFVSGIQLPGIQAQTGKLNIYLKDAPVEVDALWINITALEVHKTGDTDGKGEWIQIDISNTFEPEQDYLEFDLLKYRDQAVLELAQAEAYTGTYNKIRVTVTGAETWSWDEEDEELKVDDDLYPVNDEDYTTSPLRVPPNRIDVIIDFYIETAGEVTITIDMQPDWIAIHNGNLRPVMKAIVEYTEG